MIAAQPKLLAVLAPAVAAAIVATAGDPAPALAGHGLDGSDAARLQRVIRDHELRLLTGETLSLDDLQGEVVVMNFWATWCKPCRREMPFLNDLHVRLARSGGRVVLISIDRERRNVDRFAARHELAMPVAWDGPDGLARALDLDSIPFTVVFDRSGRVVYASTGSSQRDLDRLAAVVGGLAGLAVAAAGEESP